MIVCPVLFADFARYTDRFFDLVKNIPAEKLKIENW